MNGMCKKQLPCLRFHFQVWESIECVNSATKFTVWMLYVDQDILSVLSQNSLLQLRVIFNMIPQIWVEYALNFKWKLKGQYD